MASVHSLMFAPAFREIHPLDPQPHRHSMLVPRVCAPRVTRCRLGKYWWRDFFRKKLAGCWLESRHAQLVSRQFQSDPGPVTRAVPELDGLSRQPILGVHMLSMSHREAAIFDDACTVPTPTLLLPAALHHVWLVLVRMTTYLSTAHKTWLSF